MADGNTELVEREVCSCLCNPASELEIDLQACVISSLKQLHFLNYEFVVLYIAFQKISFTNTQLYSEILRQHKCEASITCKCLDSSYFLLLAAFYSFTVDIRHYSIYRTFDRKELYWGLFSDQKT